MAHLHRSRPSIRGVIATVLGVVLSVLLVLPWKPRTPEPIVLGVMPAPLFFWVLWTALFIVYIGWLCVVWDPYGAVVRRNPPTRHVDDHRERSA